jgi:hypothetical protein
MAPLQTKTRTSLTSLWSHFTLTCNHFLKPCFFSLGLNYNFLFSHVLVFFVLRTNTYPFLNKMILMVVIHGYIP